MPSTTTEALFPIYMYIFPFKIQQNSTKIVRSLAMWTVGHESTIQKGTNSTSINQLLTYDYS